MAKLRDGNLWLQYNTQQLTEPKILSSVDKQFQFLDPNGANRDILLPVASGCGGLEFTIVNTADLFNLVVKDNTAAVTFSSIEPGIISKFFSNDTTWETMSGAGLEVDLSSFITTSITDGDLTHCPNGNVIFDALTSKVPTSRTINGLPLDTDIIISVSGTGLFEIDVDGGLIPGLAIRSDEYFEIDVDGGIIPK